MKKMAETKKRSQPAAVERRMVSFSSAVEEQTVASAREKVVVLVIEKGEGPGVRETYESAGDGLLTVQSLCPVWRPRWGATLRHCATMASPPSPGSSYMFLAALRAPLKGLLSDLGPCSVSSWSFPHFLLFLCYFHHLWLFAGLSSCSDIHRNAWSAS